MTTLKELRDKLADENSDYYTGCKMASYHSYQAGFDEALKAICEMEFDEWHFKSLFREANPDDWHKFSHYENFYVAGAEEQLIKIKERLR